MPRRSRAREVAFQLLYRDDLNPTEDTSGDRSLLETRLGSPRLVEFASEIVAGVRSHRAALDEAIQQAAQNWELHRMAATDRSVLRLGAYELLHTDTPGPAAINEAVELAKRYGTAQSAGFVNGILDCLMRESVRAEEGK